MTGGWGLGSTEQKGPRCAPYPWSQPLVSEGRGPHLGSQQASWAQVGEANTLLSSPAPLVPEGPSHLPLLISPASGVLILSGLHFSSLHILAVHLGVPPVSLDIRVPHQRLAGTLVVGRL